jgi:serine/threonine-protein kinase
VYLIDFGIARDTAASKLTQTGCIVGTFAYMAPERFTASTADARADVYALACVLHECLTGAQPFPGDSMEQQIAGHLTLDPPSPSSLRLAVPVGFDGVIAAGMAKNPDQRYQTAIELADAAHHALTVTATSVGRPHPAPTLVHDRVPRPPAPAPERVWQQPAEPTLQRPPGWPPVPVPLPRPADWPPAQIGTGTTPLGQRPRRGLKWPLIAAIAVILPVVGITGYLLRPHQPESQTPTAQLSGGFTEPAPPSAAISKTSDPGAPVTSTALAGLLLSPDQINAAMGASGMTAGPTYTAMGDDSATVSDKACLPLYAPVQAQVYAGTGWTAVRGQQIADHQSASVITSFVLQNVVLFPSAHDAGAFFTASAQSWPARSNRQFTLTLPGKPKQLYKVGPVSNTNATLTATSTQQAANGVTCQRALTAANNIVIDGVACSFSQSDPSVNPVVNIVHQIAGKVPAAS